MPETLSEADLAARLGVKPSAISNYIARGKLTAPVLRLDGKVDVALGISAIGKEHRSDAQHRAGRAGHGGDCRAAEDARGFAGAAHARAGARRIGGGRGRAGVAQAQPRHSQVCPGRIARPRMGERGRPHSAKYRGGRFFRSRTPLELDEDGVKVLREWSRDRRERLADELALEAAAIG